MGNWKEREQAWPSLTVMRVWFVDNARSFDSWERYDRISREEGMRQIRIQLNRWHGLGRVKQAIIYDKTTGAELQRFNTQTGEWS